MSAPTVEFGPILMVQESKALGWGPTVPKPQVPLKRLQTEASQLKCALSSVSRVDMFPAMHRCESMPTQSLLVQESFLCGSSDWQTSLLLNYVILCKLM